MIKSKKQALLFLGDIATREENPVKKAVLWDIYKTVK